MQRLAGSHPKQGQWDRIFEIGSTLVCLFVSCLSTVFEKKFNMLSWVRVWKDTGKKTSKEAKKNLEIRGRGPGLGWWRGKWWSWARSKDWVFEMSLPQSTSHPWVFPLSGREPVCFPSLGLCRVVVTTTHFVHALPYPVKSFLLSSSSKSFRIPLHPHILWDTPWWIQPSPTSCVDPHGGFSQLHATEHKFVFVPASLLCFYAYKSSSPNES